MEFDREYQGPKVNFKFGSRTYVLLTYAKMKKLPISLEQCCDVLSGQFESKLDARKSFEVLVRNGCMAEFVSGKWKITPKGYEVIEHVGRARKAPLFHGAFG